MYELSKWLIWGCKPGQKDVDCLKNGKSAKFGDDAMAEESQGWVCLAHGTIGFVDANFG